MNAEGVQRPRLSADELARRVMAARRNGYAFSRGAFSEGVGMIAMPIPAVHLGRHLAIGLGGPERRLARREKQIAAELRGAIQRFLPET